MAGRTIRVTMAGRAIRVTTAGRTTEKGAHAYLTKRIITATKATATLTITATKATGTLPIPATRATVTLTIPATKATATLTITATGITDSPARGIRGATMKAGLDCRFPPTPTIGV